MIGGSGLYCPRCGTENEEDVDYCSTCGTPLKEGLRAPASRRREEDECFGLSGGALPGLVIGVIIVIIGIASILGRGFVYFIGAWGEGMGRWGESVGRFFADWGTNVGRFFADWGASWASTIGGLIAIFIGLAIVLSILNSRYRW